MVSPDNSVMQQKLLQVIPSASSVTLWPATALYLLQKVRVNDVERPLVHHNQFPESALMTTATKPPRIQLPDAHRRDRTAQLLLCRGDSLMCDKWYSHKAKGTVCNEEELLLVVHQSV